MSTSPQMEESTGRLLADFQRENITLEKKLEKPPVMNRKNGECTGTTILCTHQSALMKLSTYREESKHQDLELGLSAAHTPVTTVV
ncbi:hypothetical protein T265_05359 [Opisthorchis viverrini]|uniref:Uncharacterized protein n=1 Tax=Opisthorchis viverrini TaxID=6198 RepID=A0A074ZWA2_OPIVI|nr:hypothetical protein T265_05359 [Opisthorchis viverrini]KER27640.1 hypothetical protein T265_05359 [Opisthorchis viverrini]